MNPTHSPLPDAAIRAHRRLHGSLLGVRLAHRLGIVTLLLAPFPLTAWLADPVGAVWQPQLLIVGWFVQLGILLWARHENSKATLAAIDATRIQANLLDQKPKGPL